MCPSAHAKGGIHLTTVLLPPEIAPVRSWYRLWEYGLVGNLHHDPSDLQDPDHHRKASSQHTPTKGTSVWYSQKNFTKRLSGIACWTFTYMPTLIAVIYVRIANSLARMDVLVVVCCV